MGRLLDADGSVDAHSRAADPFVTDPRTAVIGSAVGPSKGRAQQVKSLLRTE